MKKLPHDLFDKVFGKRCRKNIKRLKTIILEENSICKKKYKKRFNYRTLYYTFVDIYYYLH